MSKRFTDTEKWKKGFIRGLNPSYKLLWLYILDECTSSGIWEIDIEVAEIKLGVKISRQKAEELFKGRIVTFDNGAKWFIPAFIEFQYGVLAENNRAHTKAISELKKFNLIDDNLIIKAPIQAPYNAPYIGAMDMVKDMDKEKEQVEDMEDIQLTRFQKFQKFISERALNVGKMKEPFTEQEFINLLYDFEETDIADLVLAMHNYKDLIKKNVSANLTLRNWAEKRNLVKKNAKITETYIPPTLVV